MVGGRRQYAGRERKVEDRADEHGAPADAVSQRRAVVRR